MTRFNDSLTDPLTGVYNVRHLLGNVTQEVERSRRSGSPLAVLLIDLDRFKSINHQMAMVPATPLCARWRSGATVDSALRHLRAYMVGASSWRSREHAGRNGALQRERLAARVFAVATGKDRHELVAAVPRADVVEPNRTAARIAPPGASDVAGTMAMLIVDRLESIEVDQQHRQR